MDRLAASVAAALFACGPSAGTEDGDGSSEASTTSTTESGATLLPDSSGGPALEPVPVSCASQPVAGIDPLAGEVSCETYYGTDGPPAPEVEVRIVNRTEETIVVKGVANRLLSRYFEVSGSMGARDVVGPPSWCGLDWNTCNLDTTCDLLGDPPPPSLQLVPNGWYADEWDAWVISSTTLPEECGPTISDTCSASLRVSAGTYELRADAMPAAVNAACSCDADARGGCKISADACRVQPTIVATARYDGVCDTVEIAFE